jgi:hypothetical protein
MDKIVTFEGGGYSGCFNEINIAFYNSKCKLAYAERWVPIFITGEIGKQNFAALKDKSYTPNQYSQYENEIKAVKNPQTKKWEFDLDVIKDNYSACCCSRIAAKFGPDNDDYALLVTCSDCKKKFDILDTDDGVFQLDGCHGIGGIASQYDDLYCPQCVSERECGYCNELCEKDDKALQYFHICTDCLNRILDNSFDYARRELNNNSILDHDGVEAYVIDVLQLDSVSALYKLLITGGEALDDEIDNQYLEVATVIRGLLTHVNLLDNPLHVETLLQEYNLKAVGMVQSAFAEEGANHA